MRIRVQVGHRSSSPDLQPPLQSDRLEDGAFTSFHFASEQPGFDRASFAALHTKLAGGFLLLSCDKRLPS